MQCLLHAVAGPLPMTSDAESEEEPYESAMDYGATTDALPYKAYDSEEESDDVVAYDTETSHLMMVADRNHQRKKQQQRQDWREKKKQRERRARGVTLPLCKNSMKEGATMYIDWRNSVDEPVQAKVGVECIKSLVLQSLEGPPKDTASLANKRGKGNLPTYSWYWTRRTADRHHMSTSSRSYATYSKCIKKVPRTTLNEWCGSR